MDDLNPDNEGNKLYETEPSGIDEEAAGFSAQAQRDRFLGGVSENQPLETGPKSLKEKTTDFFNKHRTAVNIGAVGSVPTLILGATNPLEGVLMAGAVLGAAAFMDKVESTKK